MTVDRKIKGCKPQILPALCSGRYAIYGKKCRATLFQPPDSSVGSSIFNF
jgi:hypothetical protein